VERSGTRQLSFVNMSFANGSTYPTYCFCSSGKKFKKMLRAPHRPPLRRRDIATTPLTLCDLALAHHVIPSSERPYNVTYATHGHFKSLENIVINHIAIFVPIFQRTNE
jgi:hypothetical protein